MKGGDEVKIGGRSFKGKLKRKLATKTVKRKKKKKRGLKKFFKKLKKVGRKVAKKVQRIVKNKGVQKLLSTVAHAIPYVGGALGAVTDAEFAKLNKIEAKRAAKALISSEKKTKGSMKSRSMKKRAPLKTKKATTQSYGPQYGQSFAPSGMHRIASTGRTFMLP